MNETTKGLQDPRRWEVGDAALQDNGRASSLSHAVHHFQIRAPRLPLLGASSSERPDEHLLRGSVCGSE